MIGETERAEASERKRLLAHLATLGELPVLQSRLQRAATVGELLACAAELTAEAAGYGRGLAVAIRDGRLTADALDALADARSDRLRRALLAEPQALQPHTLEDALARLSVTVGRPSAGLPSTLATALELSDPTLSAIVLDANVVALLVLDRPAGPQDELDAAMVGALSGLVAMCLGHIITRKRIEELSTELRHMTVSARTLAMEAFHAPASLPIAGQRHPTFPFVDGVVAAPSSRAVAMLTPREREIAVLLARGRSNREIADQLFLSPETVKDAVGRVVRKLGASNRLEAAIRFLGFDNDPLLGGQ